MTALLPLAGSDGWEVDPANVDQYYVIRRSGSGAALFTCKICSKTMKLRSKIRRHLQSVHCAPTNEVCPYCTRTFKNKPTLASHIRLCNFKPFSTDPSLVKAEEGKMHFLEWWLMHDFTFSKNGLAPNQKCYHHQFVKSIRRISPGRHRPELILRLFFIAKVKEYKATLGHIYCFRWLGGSSHCHPRKPSWEGIHLYNLFPIFKSKGHY